ncbi:HAD hydrolase-like protein [Streptomyces zagrosensis]|uniref:HAD superfamily hydrolase (TIGR01450 family) n=1 Tax=Streptomyces zagrosensis TaxID=1042984 RepID=A0A7W9QC15_9ACTN|nr:HAD hydrolase-like protein [Streptomyces zagrosensis]MBB5937481.1 HAD superfamily hydrolase (TIGR01450 family) [Streptomyces zagrosensis]
MSESVRTRPGGSARPLHEAYDTALLDLDGVVYAGGEAIAYAAESLEVARSAGMHLAYVTNNAFRTPQTVAEHLTSLGVPAEPGDVITSAQAVARLISEHVPAGAQVLAIGGEGLWVALRERGLVPVDSADEDIAAVVQGYGGPKQTWDRLMEAGYAVARGVPWYASNTDLTIPTGRGIAPGNGAAVEVVRFAAGGAPQVAGKPQPPMHRETILRTAAERPLVVGDRLDTDIEGAHGGGVDSLLVLTGVTTPAQLLAAEPEHRPTFVAADLRGMLTAHPEVEVRAGGAEFACAGWTASVRDAEAVIEGSGDPLDGLRALCAATWTAGTAANEGGEGQGAGAARRAGGSGPGLSAAHRDGDRINADKALARLGW